VNNAVVPSKPYTNEAMEADLQHSFETISILVSTLGLSLFQPALSTGGANEEDDDLIFEVKRHDIVGRGQYTNEGFVVLQGSQFHESTTKSLSVGLEKKRQSLIDDGILIKKENYYELIENFLFSSPSYAAACVTGRSSNGWTAWVRSDGKTLSDIYRGVKPRGEESIEEVQ
jgi:hypothetical protein